MSYRNMFPALLITISAILLQGCGNHPIKYVQAYYDKTLKESEISWVKIGGVYNQNNERKLGEIQVKFEDLPQNSYNHVKPFQIFAFPAGDRTIQAKYRRSTGTSVSYTDWIEITKFLEGGKCYVINDRVNEAGLFSLDPDLHSFRFEDSSCTSWFSKQYYDRVELYRLGGYEAMPKLDLIKTYALDDAIFSTLRDKGNNNNRLTIPYEFIRKLYEQLE